MASHQPFVRNQGNVLLVKKGNPKRITTVDDLKRRGITVFLSNPNTEKASHRSYRDTLANLLGDAQIERRLAIYYGERIHHREAPESLMKGHADAAVLFYHLALYFTRLCPDEFEIVPLGGSVLKPEPPEGNRIGTTHVGLIGNGGRFGQAFVDFLKTEDVQAVYRHHGLLPL
jgi:molybdate-binding protein